MGEVLEPVGRSQYETVSLTHGMRRDGSEVKAEAKPFNDGNRLGLLKDSPK